MLILQGILIRRGRAAPPSPALGKANAKRCQTKFTTLNYTAKAQFILLANHKYNFTYILAALEDGVSILGLRYGKHFIYGGFN